MLKVDHNWKNSCNCRLYTNNSNNLNLLHRDGHPQHYDNSAGEPVLAADSMAMALTQDSSVTVSQLSIQQRGTPVSDTATISMDNQSGTNTSHAQSGSQRKKNLHLQVVHQQRQHPLHSP